MSELHHSLGDLGYSIDEIVLRKDHGEGHVKTHHLTFEFHSR